MLTNPRILVFMPPDETELFDHSMLLTGEYDVVTLSQIQAIESWLNTFLVDVLLVIVQQSADEGLGYSAEILKSHPYLPIILVTRECTPSLVKQAMEIGLVDYLTIPVESASFLRSVQRGLVRQKSWQEWNRYARVLDELRDGFILVDLNGHLLTVNRSAREIFLVEADPLEGRMVNDVFTHPDLLDIFIPEKSFPRRSEISLEDGRVFSAQASLITEIGIGVVLQEITHLKELDQIKTDFVNTVSHDLRSPLTAIYGFAGLIDRVGKVNEQQAEFIGHIQSSVQHITSLISDLLELGRVEADHDIQMENVNLLEIVNRSVLSLDYQLNEKMQELVLSLPEEVPQILGNPIHLQRMITNLVENAIKFTQPMGKINLRCKAEANQLMLEVADNGPGIPLDEQPLVFDKFYRCSNLSENTPGTGLGLSIVKSIVEKHHGRIWLDSSPVGTTFTVILPVR